MDKSKGKKVKIIDIRKPGAGKEESAREIFKPEETVRTKMDKTEILENLVEKEIEIEKKNKKSSGHVLSKPAKREVPEFRGKKGKFQFVITLVLILAFLSGAVYAGAKILPRAEVKIVTKKADWEYNNSIRINSKIADIDVVNRQIPSAVFSQKKNATISWPATGKKYVERKASGSITILNEYSSNPQIFVADTRFEAPDGKIFRLKAKVTVPGAKIESGKIIASNIDADVIADKAGEAYNISPVSKFTIPGLKGTEKYGKFYGRSQNPMSGGFVGQTAYPTDDDVKKAKVAAESQVKSAAEAFLLTQISSENFKVVDGTTQTTITKETVSMETDNAGNFSVYAEANSSIQAFKESGLLDLMSALAAQTIGNGFQLKSYKIDYKPASIEAKTNLAVLPIGFSGIFWMPVDSDSFAQKIISKSDTELKTLIFSSSNIEKADISFWPFWVSKVPDDSGRIKVTVE